jgi:hypothetical protein
MFPYHKFKSMKLRQRQQGGVSDMLSGSSPLRNIILHEIGVKSHRPDSIPLMFHDILPDENIEQLNMLNSELNYLKRKECCLVMDLFGSLEQRYGTCEFFSSKLVRGCGREVLGFAGLCRIVREIEKVAMQTAEDKSIYPSSQLCREFKQRRLLGIANCTTRMSVGKYELVVSKNLHALLLI